MLELASFHFELISDKNNTAQDPEIRLECFGLFWFYFILLFRILNRVGLIITVLPAVCLYHSHLLKGIALAPSAEVCMCPSFRQGTLPELAVFLFTKQKQAGLICPRIVDHTETREDTLNVEKLHCSFLWPRKPVNFL